ncbi:MAG: T9SS type A sorting domain-containing protein [Flavobacteriales bacterium]|nr:T9SS type A sorting domain-containing protein [Flavobacteriales bacterium]
MSGDFHFIDDPSTQYSLLRFDGHELCAIGGVNTVGVNGQIAFFQGDLYMALASQFPGLEFEYIGRLPLEGLVPDRCVEVVTGLADHQSSFTELQLSPNPTTDQLTLHHPALRSGTVAITDALGRIVFNTPWRNQPLDVRPLPTGVYHLTLRDEHGRPVAAGRFVKE